jgi:hypothetical protein
MLCFVVYDLWFVIRLTRLQLQQYHQQQKQKQRSIKLLHEVTGSSRMTRKSGHNTVATVSVS